MKLSDTHQPTNKKYEYIQLEYQGTLSDLNKYSEHGWRVVCVLSNKKDQDTLLLERELVSK